MSVLPSGESQQLLHRPNKIGETGSHRWRAGQEPLWRLGSSTRLKHVELETQRQVGAAEVIREAGAPLLQVGIEFAGQLGGGSGVAGQSSQTVTEGEVDPFDEGRVDRAGEAGGLASDEIIEGAEAHTAIGSPDCLVTMPKARGLPYVYTGNASLAYAAACYWACHIQTYHQDSQGIGSKAIHTYRSWVLSRKEEFTYI